MELNTFANDFSPTKKVLSIMKKLLLLSAMLFACLFTANAQYQRRLLVEEFTNASCPPCAAQNPGFNAILKAQKDLVTPVKYQTNWPGVDPMNAQNPTEVATRVAYYGVTGVPHGVIDGSPIVNDCNGYEGAPGCLEEAEVTTLAAETTPVKIDLQYAMSSDVDSMVVTVTVTSDVALAGDLRLYVAIVEDAIYFAGAPGSNGETEFFQPMRKMLPNAEGTAISAFTAGETKTYTFAWTIPAFVYNENQLGASAWLQNYSTKEVYQSARAVPATPGVGILGSTTIICNQGSSPSFTMTNEAETPLTSALLRYRLGTAAWQDYTWTGNLAPGASTSVTLTGISITQTGINTVNILAVNSNNGANQTNLNEGYATVTVKALFDAASSLPVANTFQSATFPPTGWSVINSGANGWKLGTAGAGSTRSAKNNMFDYPNAQTELYTPKTNLTSVSSPSTLTYDYAYTYYNDSYFDSLRIDITTDCGATWTTLFHDGYEGLATAPANGSAAFTPTAAQWVNNSIDLTPFNGSEVLIRFVAESGYGNNLYIDNVNITTATGVTQLDLSTFTLSPNPTRDIAEVRFGLDKAQSIKMLVYNTLGTLVQTQELGELTSGDHSVSLDATRLSTGSYRVVLQGSEGVAQTQMVVVK